MYYGICESGEYLNYKLPLNEFYMGSTIEKILKFIPCRVKYSLPGSYKAAASSNESKIPGVHRGTQVSPPKE